MSIQTLEELADHLDGDLAWRKKEITTLSFAAETASAELQGILYRASTAMLYAHWEGFVKNAAKWYLSYVAVRRVPLHQLCPSMRALIYRKRLVGLAQLKLADVASRVDALIAERENPCVLPEAGAISTRRNLNYAVFCGITEVLGFGTDLYSSKSVLIDEKLLYYRNHIAHGVEVKVQSADFLELRAAVLDLIGAFCVQVYEAAATSQFRAAAAARTNRVTPASWPTPPPGSRAP